MPVIARIPQGTITGIWGKAYVRGADGKLHLLKVGDKVAVGDQILTSHDGIVRLTDGQGKGFTPRAIKLAQPSEIDALLADLNTATPRDSTAAGLTASGSGGSMDEGLRVERIVEVVTPLAFAYSTPDRGFEEPRGQTGDTGGRPALPAAPDTATTAEDTPVDINVTGNDGDGSTTPLTVTAVNGQAISVGQTVNVGSGTVELLPNGQLRFTPAPDYNGPVNFQYTVADGTGRSTDTSVNVNVTPAQDPPVATDDVVASILEDTPASGNVLGNDRDIDGDPLSVTQFVIGGITYTAGQTATLPGVGTLVIAPNGDFTFTPAPNYTGPVPPATYTLTDGTATATAVLSLPDVTPVNDPPVATPSSATGAEDTPIPVALTGTDVDGTVAAVTVTALPPASQGVLTLADGVTPVVIGTPLTPAQAASLVFVPAPDYNGPANVTFTVTDNLGAVSAPAAATITVTPVVDPVISIDDVTVNEAAGTMTFTVTLDQPTTATVGVNYATTGGTATAGADFTAATGALSFAPGETSKTITVAIGDDAQFELSEAFNVVLSNPVNGVIGDGTGVGTILDDGTGAGGSNDDRPTLAVSDVTVNEADGFAVFDVTLSNPSTSATPVTLALTDGTANAGGDYTSALEVSTDGGATWTPASTATFAPNATSVLVRVPLVNDLVNEAIETFTLTATSSTPALTANASAAGTATVLDNDGPPQVAINDVTVNEAAGTITFTVSLTNAAASAVTVDYAATPGTATAPADYTAGVNPLAGTLTFAPGVTTQTIQLSITDDIVFENSEQFTINLSNAAGPVGVGIADAVGVGTILDNGGGTGGTNDDRPVVSAITSPSVLEGAPLDFTVTLSNPSALPTTVNLTPASGTATVGTDTGAPLQASFDGGATWVSVAGTSVTVPANVTSFIVRVPTVNDGIGEPGEAMTLGASTAQNVAPVVGTGSIADANTPSIAITGPAVVNEAAGTVTYTVTLSNASTLPVSVAYATADGTAIAGTDYTAGTGTLNFAPGETSKTFTVAINNDAVFEGSEAYSVNLSAPTNATIATGSVSTTIADDGTGTDGTGGPGPGNDDRPVVSAITSPSIAEGGNLDFTVTMSGTSTTPTTVTLSPASGSATLGTDTSSPLQVSFDGGVTWAPIAGTTVSVPAGSAGFIVRVPTTNDIISEPSENITLGAATPQNVAPVVGTGTIIDNDGTPTLSISGPAVVNEAAGTVTYTVTLSNPSSSTVTVGYGTSGGTATSGADFTATAGTLTFAPGTLTQTFSVPITNDTVFEGSEAYSVNLSAPTNATIATGSVSTTINDDGTGTDGTGGPGPGNDDRPVVSAITSPSIAEGGNLDFTVTMSGTSTTPTTVTLSPASGSATLGTDTSSPLQVSFDGGVTWAPIAGTTVSVPAGSAGFIVRVPTVNDPTSEANETITLGAATPQNVAPVVGTGTIVDNDGTPQFTVNDVSVNEGAGTITFTVSLSNPSAVATTVNYASAPGTATTPADYSAGTSPLAGTLTFAPGVLTQTITLNVANDTLFEGSESFTVNLSGATGGALIGDAQGIGTILDDGTGPGGSNDDRPLVSSVSSPTIAEGGNLDFTVTLSNASTTPTTVTLGSRDGTGEVGTDTQYPIEVSFDGGATWTVLATPDVTVPAGVTSFIARVPTTEDAISEPSETVFLQAATARNTVPVEGTGTITDNDGTPTLSISGPVVVNEAAGTVTYTVTLSNPSSSTVTVGYGTSGGTATSGADFTATAGTLTFAPGTLTQTFSVPITNDNRSSRAPRRIPST